MSPNIRSDVASLKLLGPLKEFLDHKKGLSQGFSFSVLYSLYSYTTVFRTKAALSEGFPKLFSNGKYNAEKLLSVARRYGHTS